MKRRSAAITSQLNIRLIIIMSVMFVLTSAFSFMIQYNRALEEAGRFLSIAIDDERRDLANDVDEAQLTITRAVIALIENAHVDDIAELSAFNYISELNIIDANGTVTDSTDSSLIGFDLNSMEESAKFFAELRENGEAITPIRSSVNDPETARKYSGSVIEDGRYIQIGYSREDVDNEIGDLIGAYATNRHVLEDGMMFIINEKNEVVSKRYDLSGDVMSNLLKTQTIHGQTGKLRRVSVEGKIYYSMYEMLSSYKIVAILSQDEIMGNIRINLLLSLALGVILFITLYFGVWLLVRRLVVRPVNEIAKTLGVITEGDLDAKVSVHSSREFDIISGGINATVSSLKDHIVREATRIDDELRYAREIQYSVLPALSEPYTDSGYFSLSALMDTAKEVGGDFYDFCMPNGNSLAFMIADVSGKGIPAAMFMMNGKATLHDCIIRRGDLGDNISRANRRICEGNDAGMFITSWIGMLDLKTGMLRFVDAGHNPPVLIRDGKAEFPETKADLLLGVMDDEEYRTQVLQLKKGDILFLYTDGVTEAVSSGKELYGEERLKETLNGMTADSEDIAGSVCRTVAESVGRFSEGAPQADDITMLCLYYKGTDGHERE